MPESEPWQPPTYREVHFRPGYSDYVCSRCGSFIENIIEHNRHHRNLDRLLEAVLALTSLVLPSSPKGQLLEMIDVEHARKPEDGPH